MYSILRKDKYEKGVLEYFVDHKESAEREAQHEEMFQDRYSGSAAGCIGPVPVQSMYPDSVSDVSESKDGSSSCSGSSDDDDDDYDEGSSKRRTRSSSRKSTKGPGRKRKDVANDLQEEHATEAWPMLLLILVS